MKIRYFTGNRDKNWHNPKNWSTRSGGKGGAGVPGKADTAIFDDNSPACVIEKGTVAQIKNFYTTSKNCRVRVAGILDFYAEFLNALLLHSQKA